MATQTKDKPSDNFAQEAALATDSDARKKAQARALEDQLRQQADDPTAIDAGEQSARAAASAEGGGAWPQDLLLKRYVQPVTSAAPAFSPEQNYTSHEDPAKK